MRIVPFLLSLFLTTGLIVCLNRQWGGLQKTPVLGSFLSPQHGFWQNAEPVGADFSGSVTLPGLKDKGDVYFDEYLVPHVYANSEADACYIQGYLHAKFRLWQMEFQTFAAAGRLSEVLGAGKDNSYLTYDRAMRRLGMVTAAQASLAEMEKDSSSKKDCDAYTAGVNAWISQLKESDLPLEYKLLNYRPEPWTNLKIALFVKYMAYDLAGGDNDFEMTNAKSFFSKEDFAKLYPAIQDSLDPIIPKGKRFLPPFFVPKPPRTADSLYFNNPITVTDRELKPEKNNGSNNWAVSGVKTLSHAPILCNDPHLSTNLPAIWYQMQIHTPGYNAYGVSFPGAPFIIIGFNDNCAWGITNAGRDVRDYYSIKFKDDTRREYWFDKQWKTATTRVDTIKIKDAPAFYDTVASTVFGPVMFDPTYTGYSDIASNKSYAVRWKAADASNELAVFSRFQSMTSYDGYKQSLELFKSPGQNFVFADKAGVVAIRQEGEFPAKWKGQGLFVMPGEDSSYMWQSDSIRREENPYMIADTSNRGFVSSANQEPVDSTYPYYLGSDFPIYRGLIINRYLNRMNSITPPDMMKMQTDNFDVFAEMARPLLLRSIDRSKLSDEATAYLNTFRQWNLNNDPSEEGPVIFKYWWSQVEKDILDDDFSGSSLPLHYPQESTVLEALLKDTAWSFIDNKDTKDKKETLGEVVTAAFLKIIPQLQQAAKDDRLTWAKNKDTWARHLLRLPQLSRTHLPIGGGVHSINAAKQFHGPSWRMIVQLTAKTEAYGVYPGGQSGNPGSPYYDTFIDSWAMGRYYPLWVMAPDETKDKRIKWTMHFNN
jgi:penicillin amidase